jgi:hypothetical protein
MEKAKGRGKKQEQGKELGTNRNHVIQVAILHGMAKVGRKELVPGRPQNGEGSKGHSLHVSGVRSVLVVFSSLHIFLTVLSISTGNVPVVCPMIPI